MAKEGGDPTEQRVTPLELFVLRPGFRLRPNPGDRLSRRPPQLGLDDPGCRAARGAVVGVGRIREADQRRAGRGGDISTLGDPDDDGGHAGCPSSRPRRLRNPRAHLRALLLRRAALAGAPVRPRHRRHAGDVPGHPPALDGLPPRPGAVDRGRVLRWLRPGALWAVALAIDYGVAFVGGVSGFRVHAAHFVERHGLIIIIALGESIVAVGVGVSGLAIGAGVIVAAVLGVALAAGLWWAYFDLLVRAKYRRFLPCFGSAANRSKKSGSRSANSLKICTRTSRAFRACRCWPSSSYSVAFGAV